MKNKISIKELKKIQNGYIAGEKTINLAKMYNVSQSCIIRNLNKLGVPLRGTTKYSINKNIFKKINNPIKAYFLGFAVGDGSMYKPKGKNTWRFTLEIKKEDSYILEEFNKLLSYNKPIVFRHRNKKWQPTGSLVIHNQNICNDLIKNGIVENKSFTSKFPKLPQKMRSHFIRGLFDSDGNIYKRPNKNSFQFSMIGSPDICKSVHIIFAKYAIYSKIINLSNYSKPLNRIVIYRNKDLIKTREFMYGSATCFLSRKKEVFDRIGGVV